MQTQQYNTGAVEEFNVLKTDKKVRHGTYVRYLPRTFAGVVVLETGSYDHGQKEGEWRTFSEERPWWNRITSVGAYHTGEKEGIWTYYHRYMPGPTAATTVNKEANAKTGYSVDVKDTTAIVQAQGLYAQGKRVGVWTYFDRQKQVVQKVNHFSNQLLYWQDAAAPANHPLLYAGGKDQLRVEIMGALGPFFALGFDKNRSAEFIYQVDAAGKQLAIVYAEATGLTRYEKQLLQVLAKVPPYWVPQLANGQPMASQYRVKISIEVEADGSRKRARALVEPLGS
ncbi:toxin-antitoxin system YwqK family antitoxin [Hymenobacter properus]|uniref:Uncharacterized protein n=1 Tax=Hymenobacter properus TaxID=2791026 RepID=A0A931BE91_9BACT|nr:hypothetical protein [Hymenobacter properus]MBF9140946.1 hypothetical protein [Hymenobacter properus]MBR7719755.1 hypothetical protein [Microvirga sp. SRT04]